MTNLLRVELFKFCRSKVFWVLIGITVIVSFLLILLLFLDENGTLEKIEGMKITAEMEGEATELLPIGGMKVLIEAIHAPDLFITILLISILGSFFIAVDHSTGTIKNMVSIGYHRTQIYLAKLAIFSLGSIVLILFFALIMGVFGSIFFGIGDWPTTEILVQTGKILFLTCVYVISFSSIILMFSMIANGSGIAFLLSFGFYLVFGTTLNLLGQQFTLFEKLNHYAVYNRFAMLAERELTYADIIELMSIPIITSLIFIFIGVMIFKKKDIK